LKQQHPELQGFPRVTQYAGGASNWTYRLEYDNADLILRRPPAGTKAKSAHDMGREYRVQKSLKPVFPYVPEMVAYCEDTSVIGVDFYVMQRVVGIIPRKNLPRGLSLPPATVRQLCLNALDALIELHQVDYQAAGLAGLSSGAGYTQRQIDGWSNRYTRAWTWNVPSGQRIMRWLAANQPGRKESVSLTTTFGSTTWCWMPRTPPKSGAFSTGSWPPWATP
jgi:aminoglycoside phosphotransferase (APT) family kinase protein